MTAFVPTSILHDVDTSCHFDSGSVLLVSAIARARQGDSLLTSHHLLAIIIVLLIYEAMQFKSYSARAEPI